LASGKSSSKAFAESTLSDCQSYMYQYLNTQILEEITHADLEVTEDLFETFFEEMDKLVVSLPVALEHSDFEYVRAQFHKHRSSTKMLGMPDLSLLMEAGEAASKAKSLGGIGININSYLALYPKIRLEMQAYLSQLDAN
jgi:hypothetical protein